MLCGGGGWFATLHSSSTLCLASQMFDISKHDLLLSQNEAIWVTQQMTTNRPCWRTSLIYAGLPASKHVFYIKLLKLPLWVLYTVWSLYLYCGLHTCISCYTATEKAPPTRALYGEVTIKRFYILLQTLTASSCIISCLKPMHWIVYTWKCRSLTFSIVKLASRKVYRFIINLIFRYSLVHGKSVWGWDAFEVSADWSSRPQVLLYNVFMQLSFVRFVSLAVF